MNSIERVGGYDETAHYYMQLADLLKAVAQSSYALNIDEITHLRWRELMGIMREIDTAADDGVSSHDAILDELREYSGFEDRYPHVSPQELSRETHEVLVRRAERILRLGQHVAAATTMYRYLRLRGAEAIQTAEIFADVASDEVLTQPAFTQSFMPALRTMGIAACFLDSAHDLKAEYETHQTQLRPTIRARLQLGGASLQHAFKVVGVGRHPAVIRETARAAWLQYERKKVKKR